MLNDHNPNICQASLLSCLPFLSSLSLYFPLPILFLTDSLIYSCIYLFYYQFGAFDTPGSSLGAGDKKIQ